MDTLTTKDLALLIVGLVGGGILGFIASWFAGYVTLYTQFKRGSGWRRVSYVADATRKFNKPNQNTGALASTYRYGMGTIIDNLVNRGNQKIPLLVDRGSEDKRADGWVKFNEYIKPVIDAISMYSFPVLFRWLRPEVRKHHALVELCDAMELVVMELDGGFENPAIVEWQHISGGDEYAYAPQIVEKPGQEERIISLKQALEQLEKSWNDWLEVTGAKDKKPGT